MISIAYAGGVAYETVDDEAVVTVPMPSLPAPGLGVDYIYVGFWSGRVLSGHTTTGMVPMQLYGSFGNIMAGAMWTHWNQEGWSLFGPPAPLVLTRTAVWSAPGLPIETLASGVSVRIVAYRVTRTPPAGYNSELSFSANADPAHFSIGTVDGSFEFTGLSAPPYPVGYTEDEMWPGDPAGDLVQHYAFNIINMIASPYWRADYMPPGNPLEIQPYYDEVPVDGCTFDTPLPAAGQGPLTRRYDPDEPYTRNAIFDSLGSGLQLGNWPLEYSVVIHTPTFTNVNTVSFGSTTIEGVDVHVFGTQYQPIIFSGHVRVREALVPLPDQPPPVEIPEFCPENGPAAATAGPCRVRIEDPVVIRLDRAGSQPVSVTAVVPGVVL